MESDVIRKIFLQIYPVATLSPFQCIGISGGRHDGGAHVPVERPMKAKVAGVRSNPASS